MKTLEDLCKEALSRDSGRKAIEFHNQWFTWGQIRDVAEQLIELLASSGVAPDDAVTFIPRNRPSALAALLALMSQGRGIRMLYAFQSAESLARQIERQMPAVVIAEDSDFSPEVKATLSKHHIAGIQLTEMNASCITQRTESNQLTREDSTQPAAREIEILTSGTTGTPKQFPISYSLIEKFMIGEKILSGDIYDGRGEGALLYFPIGNITGIHTTVPALIKGQEIVLLDRFSLQGWHDFVIRYRPVSSGIPPAAMQSLLDADIPKEDLSSLAYMGSGAAPLDSSIQKAFEERYDIPILLSYGATEFGGPVTGMTLDLYKEWGEKKFGSVGRPFPGFDARIIDAETEQELPAGKQGLLEVISPRIGKHWIRTADVAVIDEDGFVFLQGRADGAIMRGGFKVLPETIEHALLQHPAIHGVSVVGVPDERLSEVPGAAVQLHHGVETPSVDELNQFLRERLLATQIPVHWRFVESLPKTPSFKIDRPSVKQLFRSE